MAGVYNAHKVRRAKILTKDTLLWAIAIVGFLLTLGLGVYLGRVSAQRAAAGYISDMLGRFGAVCGAVSPETAETAALAFAGQYDGADIELGQKMLGVFGYAVDMPLKYTVNFGEYSLRSELLTAAFGAAAFILAAAVFGGHEKINGMLTADVCVSSEKLISAGDYCRESAMLGGVPRYVSGSMARLSRVVRQLRQDLEKEENYINGLISDISHQMKTPVAALMINCEIMQREPEMDSGRRGEFLDRCIEQLERLDWLVAGILKSARLDSGMIEFDMKRRKLGEAITEAVNLNRRIAEEKGVEIADMTPPGMLMSMDIRWLSEAFANIIKNAVEHTPEGGRIVIDGSETPLTVMVRIRDNGSGIPPELLPRIFDRFCTSSPKGQARSRTKNVGLGLSIARTIFYAHSGNIRVQSAPGKGTLFAVTFVRQEC
ncbi:MAG: HAMP domain-containing histidine kinase [Ruminococcus sp.]|nr:HAMP domain-containing histidine kinase [Ruminococcus sp.]